MESLYVEKHHTVYQIADQLNVCRQTISNKLKQYDIPLRNARYKKVRKQDKEEVDKFYKTRDVFIQKYTELKSIRLVAEFFNISVDTAYDWKKRHEIPNVKEQSNDGIRRRLYNSPWADKETFSKAYKTYSLAEMSRMWGCTSSNLYKWRKKHGIPACTTKEQWKKRPKFGTPYCDNTGGINFDTFDRDRLSKGMVIRIKEIVGECQSCGEREVLDLHHINGNTKDNRPENHVILCPNCHAKVHRLGKTVEELCPYYKSWRTYAEAK